MPTPVPRHEYDGPIMNLRPRSTPMKHGQTVVVAEAADASAPCRADRLRGKNPPAGIQNAGGSTPWIRSDAVDSCDLTCLVAGQLV